MANRRWLPSAVCTKCRRASHRPELIAQTCRKRYGEKACEGVFQSAMGESDWEECQSCNAVGSANGKRCEDCDGEGWFFAGRP